jgi:hypothetical protein
MTRAIHSLNEYKRNYYRIKVLAQTRPLRGEEKTSQFFSSYHGQQPGRLV